MTLTCDTCGIDCGPGASERHNHRLLYGHTPALAVPMHPVTLPPLPVMSERCFQSQHEHCKGRTRGASGRGWRACQCVCHEGVAA